MQLSYQVEVDLTGTPEHQRAAVWDLEHMRPGARVVLRVPSATPPTSVIDALLDVATQRGLQVVLVGGGAALRGWHDAMRLPPARSGR